MVVPAATPVLWRKRARQSFMRWFRVGVLLLSVAVVGFLADIANQGALGVVFAVAALWMWFFAALTLFFGSLFAGVESAREHRVEDEYVGWISAAIYLYIIAVPFFEVEKWTFFALMGLSLVFFVGAAVLLVPRLLHPRWPKGRLLLITLNGFIVLGAGVALLILFAAR